MTFLKGIELNIMKLYNEVYYLVYQSHLGYHLNNFESGVKFLKFKLAV